MIKQYYYLTKPGIIYGNAISMIAGFLLASRTINIDLKLFLAALIGLSLVIGSACVFNNIFDHDIDSTMERTKRRAMVMGTISKRHAQIFGMVLLIAGILILKLHTTDYSLLTALIGFFVYVFVYTPLKRKTIHATLIGAIAGATPPVVGYTAVSGKFDIAALLLFLILAAWQMPHFYAIAIRRLDEYKAASIPVLPLENGIKFTKISMLFYIILYIVTTVLLFTFKYTDYFYLTVILILGSIWLVQGIRGFQKNIDNKLWAKQMFLLSLVILLVFSITLSISAII